MGAVKMKGATRPLLLLIVVIHACHAIKVDPREVDDDGCINQVVLVEEVTYDEELQCRQLPQETCMQTMTTKYKTTKDEECKDTFTKDCYIEYINVPKSEQVEKCVTPWERDCDTPGDLDCTTEYETICEAIYHEDEVDDDVANCVTEMICKDDEDCEEEEKIARRSCTVDQEANKKYTKETECSKEPRENCDLISRKVCTPTMKVVPSMEPVTKCVEVGKEICEYVKINPRGENKPLVKKICPPIEKDLLEDDPLGKYFLARGGQSCDEACEAGGPYPGGMPLSCDQDKVTAATENLDTCKSIIESLGKTPKSGGGIFPDDNSGCCYHPGQDGWFQLLMKDNEPPKCSEVNVDDSRQRVCACSNDEGSGEGSGDGSGDGAPV